MLARSSSSCLGLKDKKSGLEALALKQSLVECGTIIRWCHSAAQLGDVVTKDSDAARAPWELFFRRGFRWKLIHDPKFESSRNRAKRGIDTLDEPDDNEFAGDVPRDPKSVTLITVKCVSSQVFVTFFLAHLFWTLVPCIRSTDPVHRDASLLGSLHQKPLIPNVVDEFLSVPCFLMPSKFVVDFVEILIEVEIHVLVSDAACTLDTCQRDV